MQIEGIDRLGLGPQHRRLLQRLADALPRSLSGRSLALALGVEQSTITAVLEPALVRLGLMVIRPGGRFITEVRAQASAGGRTGSCDRAIGEHLVSKGGANNELSGRIHDEADA